MPIERSNPVLFPWIAVVLNLLSDDEKWRVCSLWKISTSKRNVLLWFSSSTGMIPMTSLLWYIEPENAHRLSNPSTQLRPLSSMDNGAQTEGEHRRNAIKNTTVDGTINCLDCVQRFRRRYDDSKSSERHFRHCAFGSSTKSPGNRTKSLAVRVTAFGPGLRQRF